MEKNVKAKKNVIVVLVVGVAIIIPAILVWNKQAGVNENRTSPNVFTGPQQNCVVEGGKTRCWGAGPLEEKKLFGTKDISFGPSHACAIDNTGVHCWGKNDFGQIDVPQLKNPRMVTAGRDHTCALDDTGVKCWGSDSYGQVRVPELKNPRMVSAGGDHTCAIDDSGVNCWGWDYQGQTKVVPGLKNPRMIAARNDSTCVIDDLGAKCWGSNTFGQNNSPKLKNPKSISNAGDHVCAIDDDGVKCWGQNNFGQSSVGKLINPRAISAAGAHTCAIDDTGIKCWGDDKTQLQNEAAQSKGIAATLANLSAGGKHNCFIDNNRLTCWGSNQQGQLNVPKLVNPKMVSSGGEHSCAIDETGVVCWGNNKNGQVNAPKLVNPKMVSSGGAHTCAIDDSGVVCWGNNEKGQITVPKLVNPKIVSSGGEHTCAIDDVGVVCWGSNTAGQIIAPKLRNPKNVTVGRNHTCAVDEDGVKCWGGFGEEARVPHLVQPKSVAAGGDRTCTIDYNGVVCWGEELSFNFKSEIKNPKMITVGDYHICVLDEDGVKCEGNNEYFQCKPQDEVVNERFSEISSKDILIRKEAVTKLGELVVNKDLSLRNLEKVRSKLIEKLADSNDDVRFLTVKALGKYAEDSSDALPLVDALIRKDKWVREDASQVIVQLGTKAIPALTKAISTNDPDARKVIADELGILGITDSSVSSALVQALGDKDASVRASAATALTWLGSNLDIAKTELEKLSTNPNPEISKKAKACQALSNVIKLRANNKEIEKKEIDPLTGLWEATYKSHAGDGYFTDYVQIWTDVQGYRGIKWEIGVYTGYDWYPERLNLEDFRSVSSVVFAKTGEGVLRRMGLKKERGATNDGAVEVIVNRDDTKGYEPEYKKQSEIVQNECQRGSSQFVENVCAFPKIKALNVELSILEKRLTTKREELVVMLEQRKKDLEFFQDYEEEYIASSVKEYKRIIKGTKEKLRDWPGERQWRLTVRETCSDIACITSAYQKRAKALRNLKIY